MELTNKRMTRAKLWTKDFIIITLTAFLIFLTFYLLMTTMTIYATQQFQASETAAGLAASIFVIGSLVARLFAGKYIDVAGRRNLLYASLILFFISCLLYFFATSFAVLLTVRFVHGIAFGVVTTVMGTAVMSIIPPTRRGEGTSYFSLSTPLATAIGPFIGILIVQHADFNWIFVTCTIFAIFNIIVMLFAKIPESPLTKEQRQEMKGFRLQDFFEKSALPIASIIFILGITYASVLSYLNPFAIEANLTTAASLFFIVYAVFLLGSRPMTGKILDSHGENVIIYPALILFAVGLFLLSQSYSMTLMLIASALIALGFGNKISCSQVAVVNLAPHHRIGLATSTFYIAMDAGIGVGPIIIGSILPSVGYRGMYEIMAVLVVITIVMYYFLHGRKVKRVA